MSAIASQTTGVSIVCLTDCPGANQRIHQNSASLAFVRGIHRWPMNSPYKGPVTPKMFPFDDVIMAESNFISWYHHDVYESSSTLYKTSLVCCISPRVSPYITIATDLVRMILKSIIWAHDIFSIEIIRFITMVQCKNADTPLLTHWRYCSLAASHRYNARRTITKVSLQADNFEVLLLPWSNCKIICFQFFKQPQIPSIWVDDAYVNSSTRGWVTHTCFSKLDR